MEINEHSILVIDDKLNFVFNAIIKYDPNIKAK
jgi:hypothetical protein